MSRELYGRNDPMKGLAVPPPGDPFRERWPRMGRLERVSWMWQADNRFMRSHVDFTVQFEHLVADYGYFHDRLLAPLGLSIDQESWRSRMARVTNATPRHRMPVYDDWSAGDRAAFDRICGEEMRACGYWD
jgi:hypothetical protein